MQQNELQKPILLANADEQLVYRQLVHTLPIAIYGCDSNGLITFSNQAATALWGREAVTGQDLWCGSWKIYKTDGSPLPLDECPMAIALREGRAVNGEEIIIERPDGTRCNVLPHPQPIFNSEGAVVGAVNSLVDITRQRKDQKVLLELERSNNELTSFSYIASHDLQEPLRKIITFSDKLKEEAKGLLPEESSWYLDKIITSSVRMRALIEDVLNFSRVSNAEKRYTAVDLNETVKNILVDFDQLIMEKKAKISVSALPVVDACPIQMNQLFHNMISNSLKFSSADPVISIISKKLNADELKNYSGLNKNTSYYEILIKDNGIGFSEEYAERIFTIFQRLHGQSQYTGTGIGLALCRKIADNHNGVICASSKGEGAEFRIVLPKKQGTNN